LLDGLLDSFASEGTVTATGTRAWGLRTTRRVAASSFVARVSRVLPTSARFSRTDPSEWSMSLCVLAPKVRT